MSERIDKWFDNRIEAYVDGDLPDNELRMFEARMAHDPALEAAVDRAVSVLDGLGEVPRYACPVDMAERVERITTGRPQRRKVARPLFGLAAAASACAVAVALWLNAPGTVTDADVALAASPTEAELAAARSELALALSYLDKAGDLATREISEQVVGGGLIEPIRQSVGGGRETAS
ncbi:MAG: hypothetical protein AAGE01_23750 [Pseudomonadota bacterium]